MTREHIELDPERGREAAQRITGAYSARRGVFEDTSDILEYQIPAAVGPRTREHANFLFFLICQDHGVKSWRLYRRAKDLYQEKPAIFDPKTVVSGYAGESDPQLVADTGRRLGTRYPNETARQWYRNARQLSERYGGDTRLLFTSSRDSLEALRRIREFRGFGPKTGALVFRTFYGCGFFDLPRKDEVPIPVDVHDTRIAFITGLLRISPAPPEGITSGNYQRYAEPAQRAWIDVCRQADLDWLELDRALWLLGSRGCHPLRYFDCCLVQNCAWAR